MGWDGSIVDGIHSMGAEPETPTHPPFLASVHKGCPLSQGKYFNLSTYFYFVPEWMPSHLSHPMFPALFHPRSSTTSSPCPAAAVAAAATRCGIPAAYERQADPQTQARNDDQTPGLLSARASQPGWASPVRPRRCLRGF